MDPTQGTAPQAKSRDDLMLDYLMEMGTLQPQQDKIAQQQAMVNQLRQGGMQSPGMRQAGRLQMAANPLEFLGQLGQAGAGAFGQQDVQAAQEAYKQQRMDALARVRQGQQPQAGVPPGMDSATAPTIPTAATPPMAPQQNVAYPLQQRYMGPT